MIQGNTLTCPGFYAPQGREIRVPSLVDNLIQKISQYHNEEFRVTNLEMETAGYYALGKIFDHEVVSLNAIIANRITNKFVDNPKKTIDRLIELTLERV